MNAWPSRLRTLAALAFVFLFISPAQAAEGVQRAADSTVGWVYRWLNFCIFFGVIAYYLMKKGRPYFRRQADVIASSIEESSRLKGEAEAWLREAQEKLAGLEREVAELRAKLGEEGRAEAERIRALARGETKRIELAAQLEIRAAERAARIELRTAAARLAIERAESLLRQQVTPKAESALFRNFLGALSGGVN